MAQTLHASSQLKHFHIEAWLKAITGDSSLPAAMAENPVCKPADSQVQLKTMSDELHIEIPPPGLGFPTIAIGLFAFLWDSFMVFWWVVAIFMIGGWLGLIMVLISTAHTGISVYVTICFLKMLRGDMSKETLILGRKRWRLSQELAMLKSSKVRFIDDYSISSNTKVGQPEGNALDLTGAQVVTVDGVPSTAVEIAEGVRRFNFGARLDPLEQEWLVWEINNHIATHKA
eukprot:GHRR01001927.1.p1 GENE.GHRR01001927.1~~GHRR01001927.1.p1  ORF type:complete len:230 (+),score=33.85 GHRR01001927.1:101-790(+)